jgi:hypothetical protein
MQDYPIIAGNAGKNLNQHFELNNGVVMAVYTRRSIFTSSEFGRVWADYARQWFDRNLDGDRLALMKSVWTPFWGDGYAYPPEVYGARMGLDVKESEQLSTELFSQMMADFLDSPERASIRRGRS